MEDGAQSLHVCPNCETTVPERSIVRRRDGAYRCEHCYFDDTYLEGVVHQIDTAYLVTLEAFVSAIDAREHEVGDHSLRVTQFSLVTAHAYGVKGSDLVDIYCGALLHDIGKIGVPDSILLKGGPLTPEEQAVMRRHPEIGFGIVGRIGYFSRAAEIVLSHHEHYDGSGYPRGLRGGDIPQGARVFAVSDALDALTVKRPYHEAISFEAAMETIRKDSGAFFDPAVVDALEKASEELKEMVGQILLTDPDLQHTRRRNDGER